MPWCPKCRIEYVDGVKSCSDCGAELVDKLEEVAEDTEEDDVEAFLTTASGSIEADILEALLNSNGIPVLKKFRESGGYMTVYAGVSIFGVDMYVPSRLLEKAREIIENENEKAVDESQQEITADEGQQENAVNENQENAGDDLQEPAGEAANTAEETEKYKRKQRTRSWIALVIFIPGLLWLVIELIIRIVKWITKQ